MSLSIAQEAVCSRTGTTKIVRPVAAKNSSIVFEPVCRAYSGAQTIITEIPSTG